LPVFCKSFKDILFDYTPEKIYFYGCSSAFSRARDLIFQ